MPEIVQEIGAVAGLASVVGLAVLSVLYFSQARDVKRLREWAGRAPERAAEIGAPAVPGRVQAQPQPGQQQAAQGTPAPGQPVPQPVAAQGGATKPGQPVPQPAAAQGGATKPGQAAPQPAAAEGEGGGAQPGRPVPQTAAAQGGAAKPGQAPQPAAVQAQGTEDARKPSEAAEAAGDGAQADDGEAAEVGQRPAAAAMAATAGATVATATQTKPAETKPAQGGAASGAPAVPGGPGGPATPAGGRAPGAPPVVPTQRAPVVPPGQRAPVRTTLPPRPMPQQTAILPPRREPWYRRLLASPRYLVLLIAGILIVGGAAVFGVDQLTSDSSDTGTPAPSGSAPAADDGGQAGDDEGGGQKKRRAIAPASVTVAVLNGTTVPNLAKEVSERVAEHGFDVGTVANSADQEQQRAESVVLFAPGHEREATAVSRRLSINQRQPIDPASQELAGDATVVVIAGADLAR